MSTESQTLYFRDGSSDKVYQAAIEAKDDGFVVNFAFGRRGATLQTGTKTASPVTLAAAKKIYDKLINEKKAKGYTPGAEGTPYIHTDKEQRATGLHCQLEFRASGAPARLRLSACGACDLCPSYFSGDRASTKPWPR